MTINIQGLLKELVSYTVIYTQHVSYAAREILSQMRYEFAQLEASDKINKQAEMIALFIGGTIIAIKEDDLRNRNNIYPQGLIDETFKTVGNNTILETMYKVGQQALLNLPQTFNIEIFKAKVNSEPPKPFFPQLEQNTDKINLLVKFCIKYAENLDQTEVETDDLDLVELEVSYRVKNRPPTNKKSEAHQSYTHSTSTPLSNISMQILAGFIAAIGIAAVVVAFVALNAATFGLTGLIVAGLGSATLLVGIGLFAAGADKKHQSTSDGVNEDSLALASV